MKINLAAGTILSLMFWSLLSVSLFAAPMILAENQPAEPSAEVQDLIRQHQEATSPMLPKRAEASAELHACEPSQRAEAVERGAPEQGATMNETGIGEGPDAPIIRPVGKRAARIEV